jgi:hypothetical protein
MDNTRSPPILRLPLVPKLKIAIDAYQPGPNIEELAEYCCLEVYAESLRSWYIRHALFRVPGFVLLLKAYPQTFVPKNACILFWTPSADVQYEEESARFGSVGVRQNEDLELLPGLSSKYREDIWIVNAEFDDQQIQTRK